jgi:hypothetical protein
MLDAVVCDGVRLHSIAKQPTSSESDLLGSIPAELGNLTSLSKLDLSRNSLSGEKRILPRTRCWMLLYAMEFDCIP